MPRRPMPWKPRQWAIDGTFSRRVNIYADLRDTVFLKNGVFIDFPLRLP